MQDSEWECKIDEGLAGLIFHVLNKILSIEFIK
jgi:hypothetical protein